MALKPTKPVAPLPALRSDPDNFSDRIEENLIFQSTLNEYMGATNDFIDEKNTAIAENTTTATTAAATATTQAGIAVTAAESAASSAAGAADAYAAIYPVGLPFPIWDHLAGCPIPSNLGSAKFIKLTAGLTGVGLYNEGLLGSESVSGSAPSITATATILTGPMTGEIVPLINTEQSFIRPKTVSGQLQTSQVESHQHTGTTNSDGAHTHTIDIWTATGGANSGGSLGFASDKAGSRYGANSAGAHAHPFTTNNTGGDETRPRNRSATYYMRIE